MRKLVIAMALGMTVTGCASKPPAATVAKPAEEKSLPIVHIVSQHQTITISSSADGLRYSLKDAQGQVMIADATTAKFAELQPELYRNIRHYIAVHNDDAPAVSAGIDAPIPTARLYADR